MDKRDPLEDIFALRERIGKIFESAHERSQCESSVGWVPVVDIYETPDMFVLKADLPDVREGDIDINVQGDYLKISGERRLLREGRHYHQVERCYGRFSRGFSLPEVVDKDEIRATLKDGILNVTLRKKSGESSSRRIEIKGD
ncbi:MAG TPA: HSP20 family small heat-shock protein [Dissulfurispiraceae bacterium]|nr:HSP20 family small heat-shock protein [Dissulfurispiraceae bacterium]